MFNPEEGFYLRSFLSLWCLCEIPVFQRWKNSVPSWVW